MPRSLRVLIFLAIIAFISILVSRLSFFEVISYRIYDSIIRTEYALSLKANQPVYDDITIVDIDERSIVELGQFSSWPTLYFADIVDVLASGSPLLIAFDVFFSESDSLSEHAKKRLLEASGLRKADSESYFAPLSTDAQFASAMQRAGNVFLAMFNSPQRRASDYLPSNLYSYDVSPKHYLKLDNPYPPIEILAESAYGVGFAHIEPDESGIIHSYPLFMKYKDKYFVNFSFQACLDLLQVDSIYVDSRADLYSEGEIVRSLPLSPQGQFYLKYYGPEHSFRYVSFSDVLLGRIPPAYFQDKIVLIGSSAAGLRDYRTTPMQKAFPGVELHATLMRNIIDSDYIHWLNPLWVVMVVLLLLAIVSIFIYRARPWISITVFIVFSLFILLSFYQLYARYALVFDYSRIIVPWIVCYFGLMYEHYSNQIKEKKKVRNAFEHYVSKDVISQIMSDSSALKIGGEKKPVSVLFADIRKFSTYCEECPASEITDLLHEYFNRVTNIVTLNRGLLDKYIGDAIVALYNVPFPYEDYQYLACKTALGVLEQALNLKSAYQEHPILHDFTIGIGIGSGELIIGNMGSDSIFNYTGIGDTMNLSSRIEGLNKYYKTSIIIDENTHDAVEGRFFTRYLDCVSVKGKQASNKLYELISDLAEIDQESPIFQCVQLYEQALKSLQASDFKASRDLFKQALSLCPQDYPSQLMLSRLDTMDRETWDGVWRHTSK